MVRVRFLVFVFFLFYIHYSITGARSEDHKNVIESKVLNVGEELWQEILPLQMGSRLYKLNGLKSSMWYEVKISYPASVPASFSIQPKRDKLNIGRNNNRRLLNTEKLIFRADEHYLSDGQDDAYILVTVEPAGVVAIPRVHERKYIMFNIVCDKLAFGIPHKAWWVVILVFICLVPALTVPYFLPSFLLRKNLCSGITYWTGLMDKTLIDSIYDHGPPFERVIGGFRDEQVKIATGAVNEVCGTTYIIESEIRERLNFLKARFMHANVVLSNRRFYLNVAGIVEHMHGDSGWVTLLRNHPNFVQVRLGIYQSYHRCVMIFRHTWETIERGVTASIGDSNTNPTPYINLTSGDDSRSF